MVSSPQVQKINNAIASVESNNSYSVINNKTKNQTVKPVDQWAIGKYQHYYKYNKDSIKQALKDTGLDISNKSDQEVANLYANTPQAQEIVQNKLTTQNIATANKLISKYDIKASVEEITDLVHFLGQDGAEQYINLFKQYGQPKADQIMAYGDNNHPDIKPIGGPDSTNPNPFVSSRIFKFKEKLKNTPDVTNTPVTSAVNQNPKTKPQVLAPKPQVNPNPNFKPYLYKPKENTQSINNKPEKEFGFGKIVFETLNNKQPINPVKEVKIENPSRAAEAWNTITTQGVSAFIDQIINYATEPNKGLEQPVQPLVNGKDNFTKIEKPVKEALGDTIFNYKGDANRYLAPVKLQLDKLNFGVRSRGEARDITTEGAVFTPYKQWTLASSPQYTSEFQHYLIVDKSTGKLEVTISPKLDPNSKLNKQDVKSNPNMVTTGTYSKLAKDLNLKGSYNKGIASNTLGYITSDNKQSDIKVIGVGKGDDLGGYLGGKVILSHPDGSNPVLIYGTANMIVEQFRKYQQEQGLELVAVLEADGKSYAQTIQTKDKKIKGSFLTGSQWDNQNSASTGAGNLLYLK